MPRFWLGEPVSNDNSNFGEYNEDCPGRVFGVGLRLGGDGMWVNHLRLGEGLTYSSY